MTERRDAQTEGLERALNRLGGGLAFPPTPDLAASVRTEIAARGGRPVPAEPAPFPVRRVLAIAAILVLLLAGAMLGLPGVRSAVADRLGLSGIDIEIVDRDEEPTPIPTSAGANLLLGERVSLEDAEARAGYDVIVPTALGSPDEVYLRMLSSGPMVTLLYLPREGLPVTAESGVGALLMQFPANKRPGDLAKRVSMGVGYVAEVDLGEREAFWITGESQLVLDQDPSDTFEDLIARGSANVLLWETHGLTFRLETGLIRSEALAIAESVVASEGTPAP
jgi:hypothetical protein